MVINNIGNTTINAGWAIGDCYVWGAFYAIILTYPPIFRSFCIVAKVKKMCGKAKRMQKVAMFILQSEKKALLLCVLNVCRSEVKFTILFPALASMLFFTAACSPSKRPSTETKADAFPPANLRPAPTASERDDSTFRDTVLLSADSLRADSLRTDSAENAKSNGSSAFSKPRNKIRSR